MNNNNLNTFMQSMLNSQQQMMDTVAHYRDQLSETMSAIVLDHLDASIERLRWLHDQVSNDTSQLKSDILAASLKNAIDQHQHIKDRWVTHRHQANTHKTTLRRLAMGTMAAFGVMSGLKAAPALGHEEGSSRAHTGASAPDQAHRSSVMGVRGVFGSHASGEGVLSGVLRGMEAINTATPIVSLGAKNVANIDLGDPSIDEVLTSMVVDASGKIGRYTIGARSITPALEIVNGINEGSLDPQKILLRDLAPLLICVAAEYKRQLDGGMSKDSSGNDCLAENKNVLYKNGSLIGMNGAHEAAHLKSSDLLAAFSKIKAAFDLKYKINEALMTNPQMFGLDISNDGLITGEIMAWKNYIGALKAIVENNPEVSAAVKQGALALKSSSIDSIQTHYGQLAKGDGESSVVLVQGVDAKMLSASEFTENAVQQVASQFNFLESVSPRYTSVEDYPRDRTQGPQASIGSPWALLLRDYAVVHNKLGDQPLFDGLTTSQYEGGYLQLAKMSQEEKEALRAKIEKDKGSLNVLVQGAVPQFRKEKMTQVFVAAPSFQGFSPPASGSVDEKICELLVASQYKATAQAAAIQSVKTGRPVNLHLTLVGQGAFNNPDSVLKAALAEVFTVVDGFNVNVFIHGFSSKDIEKIQSCIPGGMSGSKIMSKDEFFKK